MLFIIISKTENFPPCLLSIGCFTLSFQYVNFVNANDKKQGFAQGLIFIILGTIYLVGEIVPRSNCGAQKLSLKTMAYPKLIIFVYSLKQLKYTMKIHILLKPIVYHTLNNLYDLSLVFCFVNRLFCAVHLYRSTLGWCLQHSEEQ